jgi:purine-nucleoside phosphorylase
VEGHAGKLILGIFHGVPCVFLQGRFHLYEGYSMDDVVFPTRAICGLGIETLLLTNASGGVNSKFRPGDLMLIEDHLNLMGDNPLKGPNLAQLGPRFPDLSEAYSKTCIQIIEQSGEALSIPLYKGVYAGLLGPTYETPAEVRMLRTLGADAVGMSTVPESIAANHLGVRVSGISCITNLAAGLSPQKLTHQEVIDNSKIGAEKLGRLLLHAIPRLRHRPSSKASETGPRQTS